MKYFSTLFSLFIVSQIVMAAEPQLIVQKVDNQGLVQGNTYRLYAQLPSAQHSLHIVFGDLDHPMHIESTAPFYQHPFGGHSAINISEALIAAAPAVQFDSWITVGYENGTGNNMWEVGVDYADFNTGGSILANNGGWFLLPTDQKCSPLDNNLVLIGQFTSTGIVSGTLNLQGWSNPQEPWQAIGLSFTTNDSKIFGCTDSAAANYNPSATFDDGSCAGSDKPAEQSVGVTDISANDGWGVFPNPLRDNLINIQFSKPISTDGKTHIDIIDMSGKMIASHKLTGDNISGGNRVTLKQALAGGTYQILLVEGQNIQTKSIVVGK